MLSSGGGGGKTMKIISFGGNLIVANSLEVDVIFHQLQLHRLHSCPESAPSVVALVADSLSLFFAAAAESRDDDDDYTHNLHINIKI